MFEGKQLQLLEIVFVKSGFNYYKLSVDRSRFVRTIGHDRFTRLHHTAIDPSHAETLTRRAVLNWVS